jgi:lysophospholipase L1-like esterase
MAEPDRSIERGRPPGAVRTRWWVALAFVLGALTASVAIVAVADRNPVERSGATGSWQPELLRGQRFKASDRQWVLDYAFADEPWAKELFAERERGRGERDPVTGWRNRDFDGKYLTVRDGRRASYAPEGAKLVVWFFGGSTMIGTSQRDDHTIPSVVARLAEQDGILIRPVNFGVESFNNYQETLAFAGALANEDRPDLVVFYDGANDVATAVERVQVGRIDPGDVYYQAVSQEEAAERTKAGSAPNLDEQARDDLVIELGAAQYRRGVEIARWLAKGAGVPIVHMWQPSVASAPPPEVARPLIGHLGLTDDGLEQVRTLFSGIRDRSGTDPVDLSSALAGVDEPTFFDFEHTNELGARVIATAMYEQLHDELEALDR